MTLESVQETSLTDQAKAVVWQIFGEGASPLTRRSPYGTIEPVLRAQLGSNDADRCISEMHDWFESQGDRHWLKPEMREAVAAMIMEGMGTARVEAQVWAVSSIDADIAARVVCARWSPGQIDSFIESVLDSLKQLCDRDHILDPTRLTRSRSADARIPRDTIERAGRLETFRNLYSHGFDLYHRALYPAIGNLLALVVELRPERFTSLIERLDHPVIQARAACQMVAATRHLDRGAPLQWIERGSCDAMIALAIVHTLNAVDELDNEIRLADHADADRNTLSPEVRPRQGNLDAIADGLLDGLVGRLAVLEPPVCARWVGELLSSASYMLRRHREHEIPPRISRLENGCTQLCARLLDDKRSGSLLSELVAGLRLTPRLSWTRHLAEIAWKIRETHPTRAIEIARTALDEHEGLIAAELKRGHVSLEWRDWDHRDWLYGLAIALVLSCEDLDLPCWIRAQCRPLALSVWDAEEDYSAFSSADRVVQHWFLVALHAVPVLIELERRADPAAVRALAELLWTHCSFAGTHLHTFPDASVSAEHASRAVVEYGEPSESWLLQQARRRALGPRSLWALADQRANKHAREGRTELHDDHLVSDEFARIASHRFADGKRFDLEDLQYWGQLWLLLGTVDEAEKTAKAILAFPSRPDDRGHKILALKLLAMAASAKTSDPTLADSAASLYRQLWPGYALPEERTHREQIDEMLKHRHPAVEPTLV